MQNVKGLRKMLSVGLLAMIVFLLSMAVNTAQASAEDDDFKIGVFWVPPAAFTNATQYDYLQEANINWIINVASTDLNSVAINKKMLDLSAERGMKAIVADSRFDKVYNNTATDEEIDEMVADYKGHPGLGGYYVMDEPDFHNISYSGHAYNRFILKDPDSEPYLNLLPYVWNKPEYERYVDEIIAATNLKILTFDNYPFRTGFDIMDDYYTNLKIIRDKGLANNLKTGAYIQAAGYFDMRKPVENELRYNVYTSLAYGMKSLYWFPYWHPGVPFIGAIIDVDGNKTDLYEPFKNLNAQIKAWGPTLMKLTSLDVFHSGTKAAGTIGVPSDFQWQPNAATDNVILSYFKDDSGRKYVMAVNRDYTNALNLTFKLDPKPSVVTEVSKVTGLEEGTNYNASTGVISADFAPGEGRLYALPADGTDDELLTNPGFEDDLTGWTPYNPSILTPVTTPVNSGSKALEISTRSMNYTGAMQDIKSILLSNGKGTYDFESMLRTASDTQTMYVNVFINDSEGDHYYNGSFETVGKDSWVRSSGSAKIAWTGELNYARIYTESDPDSGTGTYFVDDFSLKKRKPLTVQKSKLTASASSILTGTEFKVSYGLSDVTEEVYGQDIKLDYDPAVMEFVSAKSLIDGISLVETVKEPAGKLRLILASQGSTHGFSGNGQIVELTFRAKSVTQMTAGVIAIKSAALGDELGIETQAALSSVSVLVTVPSSGGDTKTDINQDGKVTVGDLSIIAAHYGKDSSSPDWLKVKKADINGDGIIDILDLAAVAKKILE
ncbi:carbohydrate binding domain-containing protein [Paenibacillus eucommiae]|uniref:Uncharacterized membrane protein YjjP (DUF1212 family) n=1 Tax=Paenibacillus eucommiae TaxID=1355755 RepID=A0ABS4INS1_9BACL|nr:cohesin domain-containing protein [Paenibacillus eucommiae]MBP1988825.1 uncharacterized membrane protein YjjP (DUF1212 family) [Paenibacillus eucommiae]